MSENPFKALNITETEVELYKLIIQLSKVQQSLTEEDYSKFENVKAADLINISNKSRPTIYELIKKLENLELIQIDQARPMSIKILDPNISIKNLVESKKTELDKAGSLLIEEINKLPALKSDVLLSDTAPLSYFKGVDKYLARLDYFFKVASKEIIIICGFLVKGEEELLKKTIAEKLKQGIKIKILYGGLPIEIEEKNRLKFKEYFDKFIIDPNKTVIEKHSENFSLGGGIIGPPFRITLVDSKEVLIAFKKHSDKDERIGFNDISGIQSKNTDFVASVENFFSIVDNFFINQLKNPEFLKKIRENFSLK